MLVVIDDAGLCERCRAWAREKAEEARALFALECGDAQVTPAEKTYLSNAAPVGRKEREACGKQSR